MIGTGGILLIIMLVVIILVTMISRKPKRKSQGKERSIEEKVRDTMAADKITRFNSERERLKYEKEKREFMGASAYNEDKKFESQTERNLVGIELEKVGRTDEAIHLYEKNVQENFVGNHPYDRLSIIYRKRGQYDEEIRVLEKAVWVFKHVVWEGRSDRDPKLARFNQRLERAKTLKAKTEKEQIAEKEGHGPSNH